MARKSSPLAKVIDASNNAFASLVLLAAFATLDPSRDVLTGAVIGCGTPPLVLVATRGRPNQHRWPRTFQRGRPVQASLGLLDRRNEREARCPPAGNRPGSPERRLSGRNAQVPDQE